MDTQRKKYNRRLLFKTSANMNKRLKKFGRQIWRIYQEYGNFTQFNPEQRVSERQEMQNRIEELFDKKRAYVAKNNFWNL